jgi:hypothetical protein
MHILFAISALCFLALVLTAIAMVRHVRSNRRPAHSQRNFAQHLFAAAKDQDSRDPRTLLQQSVKDVMTAKRKTLRHQANTSYQSTSSKRF